MCGSGEGVGGDEVFWVCEEVWVKECYNAK